MNDMPNFQSLLANRMSEFVAFKRMHGYDYTERAKQLALFDRFLVAQNCNKGQLQLDTIQKYVATTVDLAPRTREGRLTIVRQFSRYMHAFNPESPVLPSGMLPTNPRSMRFYRIEPDQIQKLMDAAGLLKGGIRTHCIRFLIGMLYCTGMRIAEALKLNIGDVDLDRFSLFIRQGKFGKDRLVAMSPSTVTALKEWLRLRSHYAGTQTTAPLFVGGWNKRLTYCQAKGSFVVLCRHCGLSGRPPPRLHDLRHNYASYRIALWRQEGKDVDALLPILANSMGHVNIFSTQLYVHINAETLVEASAKFNAYATKSLEK